MGVYIKGMEMPTSCMLCPFCVEEADPSNGEMCMVTGKLMPPCTRVRLDDCPLFPVPPHGRLIDADALYKKFSRLESEAMNALKTTNTGSVNWIKWSAVLTERTGYKYDIADALTIIPAEEGE